MENKENELKELKLSRTANALSLRKQKLNEYILKRRLGSNNQDYTIQFSEIIIKPEFKDKRFNSLLDLLHFSSRIFQDKNSDINDIKFIIYLLKQTQIKNDKKDEVSESNILKDIVHILQKYINDVIIVDELICILINFTYYLNPEMNVNLLTNDYMKIYSGNLANDNPSAQKIFYNTKLFDEIYNLSINQKSPKAKKDISIFFLANFTKGISKNKDLVNNIAILKNLVNIMISNLSKEEFEKMCLVSLGELSEIKELAESIVIRKEFFDFLYINKNTDFYWAFNKILVNLTFVNEKTNLYMIQNYKTQIFSYISKLLNSSSNIIKGQGLFLIGNFIENEPSQINEIFDSAGFYDKIYENMDSICIDIIDKVTFIINVITNSSDKAAIFKIYQKNIHLKLLNILKYNYNREIINRTIDAISDFLQKDTQDAIIRQSLLDNGIKDIFANLEIDRNDAELYLKVEEITKHYLS